MGLRRCLSKYHSTEHEKHKYISISTGMCSEAAITTRPVHTTKFTVGTDMSLRCRCRSSSTGTVRWIKNGVTVSPVNSRISMDHRKLNINGTRFTDSGNYTCYVTIDKLGTAKSEKLEIWGKYSPHNNNNKLLLKYDHKILLNCKSNLRNGVSNSTNIWKWHKIILHPLTEENGFPRELLIWLLHAISFRQTWKNIFFGC